MAFPALAVAVSLAADLIAVWPRSLLDGGGRQAFVAFRRCSEGRSGPVFLLNDLLLSAEDLYVIEGAILRVLGYGF